MDTASMFTVAPRGIAILVILLETPMSFFHTLFADRDSCGTGTGSEGIQSSRHDGLEEFDRACLYQELLRQSPYTTSAKSVESHDTE